jgi:MobA/MobL family
MAFYMLNVKIFSRGKGSCATRLAAYRAGERIRDERTRSVYNWAYRDDVVHKEILLPSRFSARPDMDWARNRTTLWNEVERTDRRDARVAREVFVVLPSELTAAQRLQLARRFGQELADRYLGAVDATVHLPRPGSTDLNHHAHLLMTPRQVTPEGIGPRTILELGGRELHALGLGPSKSELLLIRARWAQITNETFRQAGLDLRIDHRSLKARGIDREPSLRLPHRILCIERKTGMPSKAGEAIRADYHERVEARRKGPDELARVLHKQWLAARQRDVERARQRATQPKAIWSATHTAEERRELLRERYRSNESLREKQRAYRQKNAEVINQKAREARLRAKPSPALQSAQRWWKQRQKQLVQEQTLARERARGRERQHDPRSAPALTAADSARNWLAYRERQKQAELTQSAGRRRVHERDLEKSMDNHQKDRTRDYDYGL